MHAVVLKCFLEVARCGSIRKAAQNLFVASSAVNRQILRLEDEERIALRLKQVELAASGY